MRSSGDKVQSFEASFKAQRFVMGILGVNVWSRDFLCFEFFHHSIIPVTCNLEYPFNVTFLL